MNTETLKTFVLLSEVKNYTQTANQLFVAQSTVTNRIQELELELGKQLIYRNHKGLTLTSEGLLFLDYARRILELMDSASESLAHLGSFPHSIRIGTTNTIYDCHLAPLINTYLTQGNQLSVTIGHSLPLIQMLQDKTIDLAFTYVPFSKNRVECRLFATDPLLLVTHPKNTSYQKGILLSELSTIPYYYCDFNFQDLGSFIKDLFPTGHSFPLIIDRSANLLPFLLSGDGYSFLPKSLVQPYLAQGTLIEIPLLDFTLPPISSYLLLPNASHKKEDIQFFLATLSNQE